MPEVNNNAVVNEASHDAALAYIQEVRNRILFTLSIYPRISPTMLQVALGTSTRPSLWHSVLDQLIEDGLVDRFQTRPPTPPPSGRDQVYTVIQLKAA